MVTHPDSFDFAEYRTLLRTYFPRVLEDQTERERAVQAITDVTNTASRRKKTQGVLTVTEQRFVRLMELLISEFDSRQEAGG